MATKKEAASKRGAKPVTRAEVVGPALDSEKLAERNQALAVMNGRQQEVVEQFGGGLPWHADHYEAAIRGELRRGCEAFLKAGSYLIVARECAAHGEWQGFLDRLGIAHEQARRMMEASRRVVALPNSSTSRNLLEAAKTESKLIELLSLPEDQFTELATKGETDGLTLDDVEDMTVRELRAAVREARADIDAKEEVTAKLQQRLEKSETDKAKLRRQFQKATPDEITANLRGDLDAEALQIGASILATDKNVSSLRNRVAALIEHAEAYGEDHSVYLAGLFAQLERHLHRVRDEFFIPRAAVGDPATEAQMTLGEEA